MITIDPPSPAFPPHNKSALTRFLKRACAAVGLVGEVHILLTDDAQIKRLNKQFRGKNKPTDILSFPAHTHSEDLAGDLAISLSIAARQAEEHGHPLADELKILILHGLLHLAGEDHETDSGAMAARELALRRQLKLPASLIERAVSPAGPAA